MSRDRDDAAELLAQFESLLLTLTARAEETSRGLAAAAVLFEQVRTATEYAFAAPIEEQHGASVTPQPIAPQKATSGRFSVLDVLRQTPVPLATGQIAAVTGLAPNATRARLAELRAAGSAERTPEGWTAR